MTHKRADRVADLIKAELSRLILRDVADPRIQNLTVTGVKMSDDLRFARIFFVRMGEEGYTKETAEGLKKATSFFKRELGKHLKLRYVPNIEFTFDESFDYGARIERILTRIETPAADRVADAIRQSRSLLLASHVRPDGDAIGSLLALSHVLRGMGKEALVFCQDKVPDIYRFLPGVGAIAHTLGSVDRFDAVVLLDCNEPERIGTEAEKIKSVDRLIIIDHHRPNDTEGPLSLIDTTVSSTGELLVRIIDRLGVPLTTEVAVNIYTAVITDTGSFRYSNTGRDTFVLAARLVDAGADPREVSENIYETRALTAVRLMTRALGTLRLSHGGMVGSVVLDQATMREERALPEHAEGIVDQVRAIEGIRIALTYFEMVDGSWKVSFRSKGSADVERAARVFGGGGHRNASACRIAGSLEDVRNRVDAVVADHLDDEEAGENDRT
ncbi:MAG: 30S ribosome-binding factor RbfA [Syntrophales bacterium]|nr:30S ribosome-binding factor RbfA [Syntrophales bacterium]MCK9527517.1 30S ribosome-binding factor RbfA [Syntrophales bacterium]MDX9922574.1 30S ribosome-binding factor RbfA [Syntrophales bacterium]